MRSAARETPQDIIDLSGITEAHELRLASHCRFDLAGGTRYWNGRIAP